MKKYTLKPYLILFGTLVLLMSLSPNGAAKSQGVTMAFLAPAAEQLVALRRIFTNFGQEKIENSAGDTVSVKDEVTRLQTQNQLLQNELDRLQELFTHELFLLEKSGQVGHEIFTRHREELKTIVEREIEALPAKVIYRNPTSWRSSLWVDIGENMNKSLGRIAIAKDSPVVVGDSIVGVVDYVGNKQSRVRLITDSGLTPSVRVRRGEWLLAKGILHGSSLPLWRREGKTLEGTGFNYDFDDKEGLARDLRTGQLQEGASNFPALQIAQVGDLLITTGMDGVFPSGLRVATISKIELLREGDYFFELKAMPTAGNLEDLETVYILAPVGFSAEEKGPLVQN